MVSSLSNNAAAPPPIPRLFGGAEMVWLPFVGGSVGCCASAAARLGGAAPAVAGVLQRGKCGGWGCSAGGEGCTVARNEVFRVAPRCQEHGQKVRRAGFWTVRRSCGVAWLCLMDADTKSGYWARAA